MTQFLKKLFGIKDVLIIDQQWLEAELYTLKKSLVINPIGVYYWEDSLGLVASKVFYQDKQMAIVWFGDFVDQENRVHY